VIHNIKKHKHQMNNQHAYHCFEPELITFGLQNSNNNLSFLCCRVVQVMGTKLLHKGSFSNIVRRDDAVEKTTTSSNRHVELANHRAVSGHANVCRLLSFETSRLANTLTLELCCTDAYKRAKVRGFTGAELRSLTRDMVAALRHLHACGIMHRDVKPQNVLLVNDEGTTSEGFVCKIADFGLSNDMTPGEMLKTICGTPTYAAPEITLGQKYDGVAVDLWSLGCILVFMLSGQPAFKADSQPELFQKIQSASFLVPQFCSPEASDLVHKLIALKPSRRIAIALCWQHAWLASNRFDFSSEIDDDDLEKNKFH